MICQASVPNEASFFALHFPIVRFPFSHRDIIETNLQNLNIPSPVLLCRHLALPAQCREPRSELVFTLASSPLLGPGPADRPSINRLPPAERRRRGQSGGRWGAPAGRPAAPLRSPRRASPAGGALAAPAFSKARTGQVRSGDRDGVRGRAAAGGPGRLQEREGTRSPFMHTPALEWAAIRVCGHTRALTGFGL